MDEKKNTDCVRICHFQMSTLFEMKWTACKCIIANTQDAAYSLVYKNTKMYHINTHTHIHTHTHEGINTELFDSD